MAQKHLSWFPYGKIGREFINQLTKHINDWNNRADSQHVALKVASVLLAPGLKKRSQKSKARDHQEYLAKRLTLWRDGKIAEVLREGRTIQNRLVRSYQKRDPPYKAKMFAKLAMKAK